MSHHRKGSEVTIFSEFKLDIQQSDRLTSIPENSHYGKLRWRYEINEGFTSNEILDDLIQKIGLKHSDELIIAKKI